MKNLDKVNVYNTREEMGYEAAQDIIKQIKKALSKKAEIRMVFAAAPSQNEVLKHLVTSDDVEWGRITAFHMDEYIGLTAGAPQLFSEFLKAAIFDQVPFKKVHLVNSANGDDECERYAKLLAEAPIDIVCLGIGENGHIAFNDPPVADFNDPVLVKKVKLDEACRQQQVNDGCFPEIDAVPQYAFSLTIPALMGGEALFCVVPGATKREAVMHTLNDAEISTQWPSTILRQHAACHFYFDQDSCDL